MLSLQFQIDKVIFCIFLKQDWDIYTKFLQYYFPCEAVVQEKNQGESISELKKGGDREYIEKEKKVELQEKDVEGHAAIEDEVRNVDNIPSADLSDLKEMLAKENGLAKEESKSTGRNDLPWSMKYIVLAGLCRRSSLPT